MQLVGLMPDLRARRLLSHCPLAGQRSEDFVALKGENLHPLSITLRSSSSPALVPGREGVLFMLQIRVGKKVRVWAAEKKYAIHAVA